MFWSYSCLSIMTLSDLATMTLQKTGTTKHSIYHLLMLNIFSQFRYAAYRASSSIIWGKLGPRNRRPLPACIGKILSK